VVAVVHVCMHAQVCLCISVCAYALVRVCVIRICAYGVATMSRRLKICRMTSLLQGSFAKETCNFKEPTNRSHPIALQI